MPSEAMLLKAVDIGVFELADQEGASLRAVVEAASPRVPCSFSDLPGLAAGMRDRGLTPTTVLLPRGHLSPLVQQAGAFHLAPCTNQDLILAGEFGTFEQGPLSGAVVRIDPGLIGLCDALMGEDELWICAAPEDVGVLGQRVDVFGESFQLTPWKDVLIEAMTPEAAMRAAEAHGGLGEYFRRGEEWVTYGLNTIVPVEDDQGKARFTVQGGLLRMSDFGVACCEIVSVTLTNPSAVIRAQLPPH